MEPLENNQIYPAAQEKPPFAASGREKLLALLSYPLAYLYLCAYLEYGKFWYWMAGFALAFVVFAELAHHRRRVGWERWFWLGCMALCVACSALGRGAVWDDRRSLILHGFAIYYVLARADVLLEAQTSHLLPIDAMNGWIVFPFSRFFLRVRVLWAAVRDLVRKKRHLTLWTVLATAAAALLFVWIAALLSRADDGFWQIFDWLWKIEVPERVIFRIILSLPVGAYLYGLVVGTGREEPRALRARGARITLACERMRKVPGKLWVILMGAFAVLYAMFFAVQGSYLFGAFTRTLPADFTVAQYARQGFFELCGVMALNFALLWLALRSADRPARSYRPLRTMASILLAAAMLLAVTAASKLWLYIDCFGFTPLRLQSAWLIAVLFAGCLASLASLWTRLPTLRPWALFSAASLALLHLY